MGVEVRQLVAAPRQHVQRRNRAGSTDVCPSLRRGRAVGREHCVRVDAKPLCSEGGKRDAPVESRLGEIPSLLKVAAPAILAERGELLVDAETRGNVGWRP